MHSIYSCYYGNFLYKGTHVVAIHYIRTYVCIIKANFTVTADCVHFIIVLLLSIQLLTTVLGNVGCCLGEYGRALL